MKLRPSPASALALIALLAALGGTAYAAGAFTAKQKKEVAKIAKGVFDKSIAGANVNRAATAASAANATNAESAKRAEQAARADVAAKAAEATLAAKATDAAKADKASTAEKAIEAQTAQRALQADRASVADSATRAETATRAGDVDTLGGVGPAQLQSAVNARCPRPKGISAISSNALFACQAPPVQMFQMTVPKGQEKPVDLGPLDPELKVACASSDPLPKLLWDTFFTGELHFFAFQDGGKDAGSARLPFIEFQPGPVPFPLIVPFRQPFESILEGQYIFEGHTSPGENFIKTVSIHAFAGQTFCEVGGTVVTVEG